jgi:dTMP kinase
VPVEVSVARLASARTPDKFERESADFFTKIRNAYLDRARNNPNRFCIINSNQTLEDVKAEVKNVISSL